MPADDPYSIDAPAPPPPGAFPDDSRTAAKGKPTCHKFDAEMDVSEVDERFRPGSVWTVRGREIGRSRVVFMSRRMCYPSRLLIAAVHLIDDQPVPLFGRILTCDYEADGLYRVDVELIPIPEAPEITAWVVARAK